MKIKDKTGGLINVTQPLLRPTAKPPLGWGITYVIKGQTGVTIGGSAIAAVNELFQLLQGSGEKASIIDCWREGNRQWLTKVDERHHLVSLGDLIVERNKPKQASKKGGRQYDPSDFGGKGWHALQYFLAQDKYSHSDFKDFCETVRSWLDPDKNPSIGCGECYSHFTIAVNKLKSRYHSRTGAREWLLDTHNEVNKRVGKEQINKEDYEKDALWV